MNFEIIQYNEDRTIHPNAQLRFFITVNNEYQTWNLTSDIYTNYDMYIPPKVYTV